MVTRNSGQPLSPQSRATALAAISGGGSNGEASGVFQLDMKVLPKGAKKDSDEFLILPEGCMLGDRWQVGHRLGAGAFAQVYRCKDSTGQAKDIALKVMKCNDQAQDEARLEAQLVTQLTELVGYPAHCIVAPMGMGRIQNHVVLATEAMGNDLGRDLKSRDTPYPVKEVISVLRDVLSAVCFLHSMELIHCDIKLDNIVMHPSPLPRQLPRVKMVDFGSVRKVKQGRPNHALVQTNQYRAPEVFLGAGWAKGIDVWSLGTVAMELYLNCNGGHFVPSHSVQDSIAIVGTLCGPFDTTMVPRHLSKFFDADGYLWDAESIIPTVPQKHVQDRLCLSELFSKCDERFEKLMTRMLTISPSERITAAAALQLVTNM